MSRFVVLLKMNVRLLLRNKVFLFFLCMTPVMAVFVLNLKTESSIYDEKEERTHIVELKDCSDKAVYAGDTSAFIIKVYDASHTELSEYVLEELSKTGMFSVCRSDVSMMTEEAVLEQAKKDGFDDRAGVLLYLKKDFDEFILEGAYAEAIQIYAVSDDERRALFEADLTAVLTRLYQLSVSTGMDSSMILETCNAISAQMPQKEVVSFSGEGDITLTNEQGVYRDRIGYALSILTLGFLFCGVCIAYTVIEEQQHKVYTRLMLSGLRHSEYLGAKLVMTVIISMMQVLVLGICMFVVKDMEFGISRPGFLGIIFFLGLIFSVVSFVAGVLIGDVMSANYAVFTVWSVSSLLAGLFFRIDYTSAALQAISCLMPQHWFLKASEMLIAGDKSAYFMVLYITIAYLVVVMSVGGIGLKMKRADT